MHTIPSRSGAGSGPAACPLSTTSTALRPSPRLAKSRLSISVLAITVIAGAVLPVATAGAATVRVANCNDSGAGSLRDAVARASTGDVIDLTRLACNRIVLTSGAVLIQQADLTLVGPGRNRLTLDGNFTNRVLVAVAPPPPAAPGTLDVRSMTIAHGRLGPLPADGFEYLSGGCIRSSGTVRLSWVNVHHCRVEAPSGAWWTRASGGGVSAGTVLLDHSDVYSNVVTNGDGGGVDASTFRAHRSRINANSASSDDVGNSGGGAGGGVMADDAALTYSTVDGNRAQGDGGGVFSNYFVVLNKSTVSRNIAGVSAGGVWARIVEVQDSTVSGNQAFYASAIEFRNDLRINNSTIAFNRLLHTGSSTVGGAIGYFPFELAAAPPMNATARAGLPTAAADTAAAPWTPYHINNSIIGSNQTNGMAGNDFSPDATFVSGSNNLIERSPNPVPADTLSALPRLAPLARNGGPTRTHALLGDSPAIDRGRNVRNRQYDQRGPGFPRVRGTAPDIGAFESEY